MKVEKTCGPTGRPRGFCVDNALDMAMQVFWRKGYEGASLSDLTEAMGINRPSLYATYGNKETLFMKVLDRYMEGPASKVGMALDAPTAREAVHAFLIEGVELVTNPCNPCGCLGVQSALACSDEASSIKNELDRRRIAFTGLVQARLERAKEEGDMPAETDPAVLALHISIVSLGMAVQAASGTTREDLLNVVDSFMAGWPPVT